MTTMMSHRRCLPFVVGGALALSAGLALAQQRTEPITLNPPSRHVTGVRLSAQPQGHGVFDLDVTVNTTWGYNASSTTYPYPNSTSPTTTFTGRPYWTPSATGTIYGGYRAPAAWAPFHTYARYGLMGAAVPNAYYAYAWNFPGYWSTTFPTGGSGRPTSRYWYPYHYFHVQGMDALNFGDGSGTIATMAGAGPATVPLVIAGATRHYGSFAGTFRHTYAVGSGPVTYVATAAAGEYWNQVTPSPTAGRATGFMQPCTTLSPSPAPPSCVATLSFHPGSAYYGSAWQVYNTGSVPAGPYFIQARLAVNAAGGIPALSAVGLLVLATLLAGAGVWLMRRG